MIDCLQDSPSTIIAWATLPQWLLPQRPLKPKTWHVSIWVVDLLARDYRIGASADNGSETKLIPDDRLLISSIHDVGPRFEREVDQLAAILEKRLGSTKFAMLIVPDHWGESPIRPGTPFANRLRDWSDSGIEMFVHGWFHQDRSEHRGATAIKAKYMTASEGEFLGLSHVEAARRMEAGRSLIEDIIGRSAMGFVAPAWLYGQGAMEALQESGFGLAEDHLKVWVPRSGQVVARGPVVTWASRSIARTASSLAFASLARIALAPLKTVRVAVHPGDVTKSSILASIDSTLGWFAARRKIANYRDLLR